MLTILGWVGSNVAEKRRWNDGLRLRARLFGAGTNWWSCARIVNA
jgi:hypothetical protein